VREAPAVVTDPASSDEAQETALAANSEAESPASDFDGPPREASVAEDATQPAPPLTDTIPDVSRETVVDDVPEIGAPLPSAATEDPDAEAGGSTPHGAEVFAPAPSGPDPEPQVSRETLPDADAEIDTDLETEPAEQADVEIVETVPEPAEALAPAVAEPAPVVSRETAAGDLQPVVNEPAPGEATAPASPAAPLGGQWPRPHRRRVMTVANQKGGVGKTTSTVNLAAALAQHGIRVLVIDLDPQGNASTAFDIPHQAGTPSIYDVLIGQTPLADVCVEVPQIPHLWCAPATIDLAGAEIELVSVVARESRLRRALDTVGDVDYVFIDCPPSLGLLTLNAMVAASEVLIPIQCEFYALEGLSQLLNNVDLVKTHLNAELAVTTILLTMYDGRTRLADQVAAEVRTHFGGLVLDTVIPRSVRISEAPGFGQTVLTYDPGSRGAVAYAGAAYDLARRGAAIAEPGGLTGAGAPEKEA
jgi:chromosome partitioning protein